MEKTLEGTNHAAKIKQPEELHTEIQFKIDDAPISSDDLIETCKKVIDNSVKPYHPHFHNTLFGGFDQYSAFGAYMSPLINGSMYTYEMAPAFTLM